ncbi:MAG: PD-(D/E)XK nuclease family protein [Ardenticatenaceae bacterium]|nr:PD-(D/E)XK nuclease family protein [Anaerolineales bacterium]MCB8923086.1 PD-(D/E)XK nuclease family protein [Ardenticatenaceae bacterium]
MNSPLTLSRGRLETFLACQRRFQLRYLRRLPWPPQPLQEDTEESLARGQQFHQLLERYFLGLAVEPGLIGDEQVRRWWDLFQRSGLALPEGRPLPELTLTIPIGKHLLNGRFDLLILGDHDGQPFAHLFDWKTGRARREADLRRDWQTRLYLAMLAEGGQALLADERPFPPEAIAITYWYATAPNKPRTIHYDAAWHAQNWAEIQAIVAQIDAQLQADTWSLTDDWTLCRDCGYQVYCGRQEAGCAVPISDEDAEPETDWLLEPDLP